MKRSPLTAAITFALAHIASAQAPYTDYIGAGHATDISATSSAFEEGSEAIKTVNAAGLSGKPARQRFRHRMARQCPRSQPRPRPRYLLLGPLRSWPRLPARHIDHLELQRGGCDRLRPPLSDNRHVGRRHDVDRIGIQRVPASTGHRFLRRRDRPGLWGRLRPLRDADCQQQLGRWRVLGAGGVAHRRQLPARSHYASGHHVLRVRRKYGADDRPDREQRHEFPVPVLPRPTNLVRPHEHPWRKYPTNRRAPRPRDAAVLSARHQRRCRRATDHRDQQLPGLPRRHARA